MVWESVRWLLLAGDRTREVPRFGEPVDDLPIESAVSTHLPAPATPAGSSNAGPREIRSNPDQGIGNHTVTWERELKRALSLAAVKQRPTRRCEWNGGSVTTGNDSRRFLERWKGNRQTWTLALTALERQRKGNSLIRR